MTTSLALFFDNLTKNIIPNKEDIELEGGLCMPLRLDDEFIEECELVTVVNIVINKENSYD